MGKAQLAFAILACVVVFSLVAAAVGTAIVDSLTSSGNGSDSAEPTVVDTGSADEYEAGLRKDAADKPNDAPTLALLGSYLAQIGQLSEAIDWYEKSLAIAPNAWDVRLDFARYLSEGGKRNDAELQFKKITAGQPENYQAHYFLAELYRNWIPPRTAEAAAEYQKTIETGPGTYVADQAAQALKELGYATPVASPSVPLVEATP